MKGVVGRPVSAVGPLRVLTVIAASLVAACGPDRPEAEDVVDLGADYRAGRGVVETWLTCTECVEGELDAVRALGAAAVAPLQVVLMSGPDPDARVAYQRHLTGAWSRIEARATSMGIALETTRDEYVEGYLDRFDAGQRIRAVIALDAIGTAQTDSILGSALTAALQEHVLDRIARALSGP